MAKDFEAGWTLFLRNCFVIFVTVGVQLPFDRLICAVDQWARARNRADVFAQIGATSNVPTYIRSQGSLKPREFLERIRDADFVVSHAGMGSIITALEVARPILIMPRKSSLGEHRNDHQLSTARQFGNIPLVTVANNEAELPLLMDGMTKPEMLVSISNDASESLLSTLSEFIWMSKAKRGL